MYIHIHIHTCTQAPGQRAGAAVHLRAAAARGIWDGQSVRGHCCAMTRGWYRVCCGGREGKAREPATPTVCQGVGPRAGGAIVRGCEGAGGGGGGCTPSPWPKGGVPRAGQRSEERHRTASGRVVAGLLDVPLPPEMGHEARAQIHRHRPDQQLHHELREDDDLRDGGGVHEPLEPGRRRGR